MRAPGVWQVVELSKGDHPSSSHPDPPNKPGQNWIERVSGRLPAFVKRVAKHVMADSGYSQSRAIATAISQCKKWAAGAGDVKPETRAKAAKAVAEWNALKARAGGSR